MFGADTALVMDALQMVGAAVAVTAGGVWFFLRRRGANASDTKSISDGSSLEDRVQVLERIATDRSQDLADEIEQLKSKPRLEGKVD